MTVDARDPRAALFFMRNRYPDNTSSFVTFADNIDGAIIGQPVIAVTDRTRVRVYNSTVRRRGTPYDDRTLRIYIYERRDAGAYDPHAPGPAGYRGRLVTMWKRTAQGWAP